MYIHVFECDAVIMVNDYLVYLGDKFKLDCNLYWGVSRVNMFHDKSLCGGRRCDQLSTQTGGACSRLWPRSGRGARCVV